MSALENATGYALVKFRLNVDFKQIPVIKRHLEDNYSNAASLIQVSDIDALLIFRDSTGKEVATHTFQLKGGENEIPLCELEGVKKDFRSVDVKVKKFHGSFSIDHSY